MAKPQYDTWVRLYTSILLNPKTMTLPPELFRTWTLLLLVCKTHGLNGTDGTIPEDATVAFALHIGVEEWCSHRDQLVDRKFIDRMKGGTNGAHYVLHDWLEYQRPSDHSAERMRRHRDRHAGEQKPSSAGARGKSRVEESRVEQKPSLRAGEDDFFDQNLHGEKAEPHPGNGRLFPSADEWSRPAAVHLPPAKTHLEHSAFVFSQLVGAYCNVGLPDRAKGAELIWNELDADEQRAMAAGFLAWYATGMRAERKDPKFVEALPKLMTDGSFDLPLNDEDHIRGPGGWTKIPNPMAAILKKWLAGPPEREQPSRST